MQQYCIPDRGFATTYPLEAAIHSSVLIMWNAVDICTRQPIRLQRSVVWFRSAMLIGLICLLLSQSHCVYLLFAVYKAEAMYKYVQYELIYLHCKSAILFYTFFPVHTQFNCASQSVYFLTCWILTVTVWLACSHQSLCPSTQHPSGRLGPIFWQTFLSTSIPSLPFIIPLSGQCQPWQICKSVSIMSMWLKAKQSPSYSLTCPRLYCHGHF